MTLNGIHSKSFDCRVFNYGLLVRFLSPCLFCSVCSSELQPVLTQVSHALNLWCRLTCRQLGPDGTRSSGRLDSSAWLWRSRHHVSGTSGSEGGNWKRKHLGWFLSRRLRQSAKVNQRWSATLEWWLCVCQQHPGDWTHLVLGKHENSWSHWTTKNKKLIYWTKN